MNNIEFYKLLFFWHIKWETIRYKTVNLTYKENIRKKKDNLITGYVYQYISQYIDLQDLN